MKPQGKVTIFMVVMIVMLSVYYFFIPKGVDNTQQTTTPINQSVTKSEDFATLRTQLSDSRATMVATLQSVLASADVSVDDKNLALDSISKIQNLTLNEGILETKIMQIGYDDAFVQADTDKGTVDVQVYVDTLTLSQVNDIMLLAKTQFGADMEVSVKVVPPVNPDTLN